MSDFEPEIIFKKSSKLSRQIILATCSGRAHRGTQKPINETPSRCEVSEKKMRIVRSITDDLVCNILKRSFFTQALLACLGSPWHDWTEATNFVFIATWPLYIL